MIRSYFNTLFHICFRTTVGIWVCAALVLGLILVAKALYSRKLERDARIQAVPSDEIQPPKKYVFPAPPAPTVPPTIPQVTNLQPAAVRATNIGTHFQATNLAALRQRKNLSAPFGSKLRVALTTAAVSGANPAPIEGILIEDFYHKGVLLVPKFTKVFGELSGGVDGERLLTLKNWRLVYPSDYEVLLPAVPTYRFEEQGAEPKDALKEGGAGLWGFRFNNLSSEEMKLFAATFLSGVAQSIQATRATAFGYVLKDTAQNSAAQGLSAVLNRYSEQLNSLIAEQRPAILCPPGTPFWLFIETQLSIPPSALAGDNRPKPTQ